MKTILSSRKHHYVAKVFIFLITVALIAGMVGCSDTTTRRYDLTMAVAPLGSGTATDLTNGSPYAGGTVVSIKAVAAAGYQFVSWTAPAGTFANPNTAQTTFTMPPQDVTVTANFVAACNLIMAVNPVGGGTATDLTNASPYADDTVVSIKAVAAAGYQFVSWTAPTGTFANPTVAETAFTMPAQDVTVTANFVAADHLLFSDDFSDEVGVWDTLSNENGSVFYENGWLHVVDYTGAFATGTWAHQHFTDFILEVVTKLVGGTDNNWHRVMCRYQDSDNYYSFDISADGYYLMVKYINGDVTVLIEPTQSSYINQGVDTVNLIHIECIDSNLNLSVNGHVLATVTDTTFSGGDIGLAADSLEADSTEIAFDNITVTRP